MSKTSEDFDSDLSLLVSTCLEMLPVYRDDFIDPVTQISAIANWVKRVQDAAEVMQVWIYESDQGPRSMGWVDDRGRP